ncbi:MAG TPA: DUF5668 domain-containing protein [Rhodanobacteraceae bacterium]|nr:DUF5668 domain-containing protein [Rhodanobacteraceae bacterium]
MTREPANNSSDIVQWRIFPAAIIIGIGLLFLLNNLGIHLEFFFHGNWWALLILIASAAPLSRALEIYRARGRVDAEVAYFLLAGSAVVLVAVLFLFGLDWGTWWPLFVILGGLFTLVHRPCRQSRHHHDWHADDDATIRH